MVWYSSCAPLFRHGAMLAQPEAPHEITPYLRITDLRRLRERQFRRGHILRKTIRYIHHGGCVVRPDLFCLGSSAALDAAQFPDIRFPFPPGHTVRFLELRLNDLGRLGLQFQCRQDDSFMHRIHDQTSLGAELEEPSAVDRPLLTGGIIFFQFFPVFGQLVLPNALITQISQGVRDISMRACCSTV